MLSVVLNAAARPDVETWVEKTAVRIHEYNGITSGIVKMMERNYKSIMSKTDGLMAVMNLTESFENYNERHPVRHGNICCVLQIMG